MSKIKLEELHGPPEYLKSVMFGNESNEARNFCDNIHIYNTMFSFTSIGGNIDKSINIGSGPHVLRLNGQKYHKIGNLLPMEGLSPKFA